MYDTIGMFLENHSLNEALIRNTKVSFMTETGEITVTGTLANLRIKKTGYKVSVIGSLPKFYFGDNLQHLTRKDSELAVEKISDLLQLPIKESNIFRLDIGYNFILNYPVQNYYICLGKLSRFKKSQIANNQSLLYTTSTKTLQFYDKVREIKRTKQSLPEKYTGRNVLRYELQLKKRVTGSLKLPQLKAKDLYDEKFYIKGIEFWKNFYFLIQKVNKINFKYEALSMVNAKTLKTQLALIGLKVIGEDHLLGMIETNKDQLEYRQQAKRMKELVISLSKEPNLTEPNEAIIELDSKVKRAANYYR